MNQPQLTARSHTQSRELSQLSAEPTSDGPPSVARPSPRPAAELSPSPAPAQPPVAGLSLLLPITEHLGMAQDAADHRDMDGVIANILNAVECEQERSLRLWELGYRLEALRGIACTCRSAARIINEVCG